METQNYPAGKKIISYGQEVDCLYLVMSGSVEQICGETRLVLAAGSCVGLSDAFHDTYESTYTAIEDTSLSAVPYSGPEDFTNIFRDQPVYIFGFAKGILRQCDNAFRAYVNAKNLAEDFYLMATETYRAYLHMCNQKQMPYKHYYRINYIQPAVFEGRLEPWELDYVKTLNEVPNKQIEQIYGGEGAVATGVIGTLCGLMDKAFYALNEIGSYLDGNAEIILSDVKMDLFQLLFDMRARAVIYGKATDDIVAKMEDLCEFIETCGLYDSKIISRKEKAYDTYDFSSPATLKNGETGLYVEEDDSQNEGLVKTFDIEDEYEQFDLEEFEDILPEDYVDEEEDEGEDCLETILSFAGYEEKVRNDIRKRIHAFTAIKDKDGTDDHTRKLRRQLTDDFYMCYERCFFASLKTPMLSPIVEMFLHFGFMDVSLVGSENAETLYDLVDMVKLFDRNRVYTIYTWLLEIYKKNKEPSRNELDLDFKAFVVEEKRLGHIRENQINSILEDPEERVKFEMANFFKSANRATSGKLSSFCPILSAEGFINVPERMLLNDLQIKKAIEKVTEIDFGIFYRENYFSVPEKGVKNEVLKQEVLPDVILMPNTGSRGMMWQECSGVKKNTPGRLVFPIFAADKIDDLMLYACGCFRWEICRREMGGRWNDIASDCLTSDFYDYFSFYKKNRDLSTEAKDKLKALLKGCRNNMREAFAKQYITWIEYESSGNVRLNKCERDLFAKHCPFRKSYRDALAAHPMFSDAMNRYENKCAQKLHHIANLYSKYEKMGGEITPEMKVNQEFYKL